LSAVAPAAPPCYRSPPISSDWLWSSPAFVRGEAYEPPTQPGRHLAEHVQATLGAQSATNVSPADHTMRRTGGSVRRTLTCGLLFRIRTAGTNRTIVLTSETAFSYSSPPSGYGSLRVERLGRRRLTNLLCGCRNAFGDEPNTTICPVRLGLPASLPVLNRQAVELAMRIGAALHCEVRGSIL
jgi:GatB/GatE catalytic domain